MTGPDPNSIYPLKDYTKLVFLKNFIQSQIIFMLATIPILMIGAMAPINLKNITSFITMISPR